ncbi:serine proteinase inhibitor [Ancylostoma caninum]|uniref:Serine proteinase inhibitor n=1 Tax=Ancylostoma caninum TaxID=29170 RepID=A0A368GFW4_ANCCA|nr:serine proteinase inhibitor [Ancylostoma caninum]
MPIVKPHCNPKARISDYQTSSIGPGCRTITTHRVKADALSLLVSAASFASKWEYSFVKSLNTRGVFYSRKSFERKVEYMNVVKENRYYAENEHMQVLSLRYSDTSYALNIFLPKQKFALEALRTRLTGSVIQTTLSQLKSTYMTISIPKIKIKTELKLKSVLRALGVSELFSDHCDLSGITKTSALKISHASHKAIIEISEGGTTEKEGGNYYKPVIQPTPTYQPTAFVADHPFLFVLTKDHNPLFIGQYV